MESTIALLFGCFAAIILGAVNGESYVRGNYGQIEAVVDIRRLGAFKSKPVNVRGVNWRLIVQECDDGFLGVFLQAESSSETPGKRDTIGRDDTYDVQAKFYLYPSDPTAKPYRRIFHLNRYVNPWFGYGDASTKGDQTFIDMHQLRFDQGRFVKDHQAFFVVKFKVGERMNLLRRYFQNSPGINRKHFEKSRRTKTKPLKMQKYKGKECIFRNGKCLFSKNADSNYFEAGILEVVVPNASGLGEFKSRTVNVRGIDWFLKIEKIEDGVGVFLKANAEIIRGEQPGTIKKIHTYDVKATFTLLAIDSAQNHLTEELDLTRDSIPYFQFCSLSKGFREFVTWNDFIDKFVDHHDAARFFVQFYIGPIIPLLDRHNPISC